MKQIISLLVIFAVLLTGSVNAQSTMTTQNGLTLDTAINTAIRYAGVQVPGNKKTVSIVVKTLKISGTIAGNVQWQGSNDGTNYAVISTTALVDASTNYSYKEVDKGYLYYRAAIAQSGTSTLSFSATAYSTNYQ
jgi:hypothetical protein